MIPLMQQLLHAYNHAKETTFLLAIAPIQKPLWISFI